MPEASIQPVGHYPTVNQVWADLLLTSLARHGVQDVCLAPGSRSTPLTEMAAAQPALTCHTHFDERGLGFYALGLIKATGRPVAVITTSGTAVANLYPAVIEAYQSELPLIVVSADRPPELIECGANQAILQQGMFAGYPVAELALPQASLLQPANWLVSQCDQVVQRQSMQPGPVHINCMFAEPLYQDPNLQPADVERYLAPLQTWTHSETPLNKLAATSHDCIQDPEWAELRQKKGLILVGQQDEVEHGLLELGSQLGWPVLCDIQSQLKGSIGQLHYYDQALHQGEFRRLLQEAEVVLQFGGRLVSKRLNQLVASTAWHSYWLIAPGQKALDPAHLGKCRFACSPVQWLASHPAGDISPAVQDWSQAVHHQHDLVERAINNWNLEQSDLGLTEISICRALPRLLPPGCQLMIGNSMPIRLMDMLAEANTKPAQIFCNRGASGIDGQTATAAGVAVAGNGLPTLLLTGDLSLLHDLNSLALLKQSPGAFVILLLNNDGGGIFNMLPVNDVDGLKQTFYQLPHQLDAAGACQMFDISYERPASQQEFELDLAAALLRPGVTLMEFSLPNEQASEQLKQLAQLLRETSA